MSPIFRKCDDTWGKVLLLCSTLLLIAPCLAIVLFHLAQRQGLVHSPDFTGVEDGAAGNSNSVLVHPMYSHFAKAERLDQTAALVGTSCLHRNKEAAAELPPLVHSSFHHVAVLFGTWCLIALYSPSRCRGRLGLALLVGLVISFPLPLLTLMRHAEASKEYCTAKATRHVSTTLIMSVSLGPFQAISVVQTPTVTTVDTQELLQCKDTIERRVRFVGTVFWCVFTIIFCAAGTMTVSDMALPSEEDMDGTTLETGDTVGASSLKKEDTVVYMTVPTIEVEYH